MKMKLVFAKIRRALLLLVIFAAGVVVFSSLMNRQVTESASDLSDSTLPVLYAEIGGVRVNPMYGYASEMDPARLRDGLIPVTAGRRVRVACRTLGANVRSVSYEVTAPDTGRVLENAMIGNFAEDGEFLTAEFSLSEPLRMNREYPIRFTIDTGNGKYNYYTRLLPRSDTFAEEYVKFVCMFTEGCLSKTALDELGVYLEPNPNLTETSLARVDIHSQTSRVFWGNLAPTLVGTEIPTITELNGSTGSLTNEYFLTALDENGKTEYYRVKEFYRLRYTTSRIRLLDFTRETEQLFTGEKGAITADGIFLGVSPGSEPYLANADIGTVAFVASGSLWAYSEAASKLVRVFSFELPEKTDPRGANGDHTIRILRVGEGGDVDFLVSGYMTRGAHEGRQGVSVCHFDTETGSVRELSFFETDMDHERLEEDLAKLCAVSNAGELCLYADGNILKVTADGTAAESLLTNVRRDCVAASAGGLLAYMEEMDPYASKTIVMRNLFTGAERRITAPSNAYLKIFGFLGDNLLYGLARKKDVLTQPAGGVIFGMESLFIEGFDGTVVKTYAPSGIYVTDVAMETGRVVLRRAVKKDGGYEPASDDSILSNDPLPEKRVTVSRSASVRQGAVTTLKLPSAARSLSPEVVNFKIRPISLASGLRAEKTDPCPLYYVYGNGGLLSVETEPSRAVAEAYAGVGTVLDNGGQYVYERGSLAAKYELANEDILPAFLSGEINVKVLQQKVGDAATVLDLTGCTLEQVLYQVFRGRPVITRRKDGSVGVIVGYDNYNTKLYKFEDGSHYYFGMQDSTADFAAGGNVFVTYIEPEATVKEIS